MPRCARASSPGSYSATPSDNARCRCSEPSTRSSVAPTGSSTSRTGRHSTGASAANGPSGDSGAGSRGSDENRSPAITSIGGSTAASPRTAVVLAVPFSPRTSTPPTSGATAARIRASNRSSEPTMADNGYCCGIRGSRTHCQLVGERGCARRQAPRPVFGLPGSLGSVRVTAAGPVPDSHRLPDSPCRNRSGSAVVPFGTTRAPRAWSRQCSTARGPHRSGVP